MGDEVDGAVSLVLDLFGTAASEEADDLDWTSNPLADAGVKDYKADELMYGEHTDEMFDALDLNGNGLISKAEFVTFIMHCPRGREYEKNGDGDAMMRLESDAKLAFDNLEKIKDGHETISREEYVSRPGHPLGLLEFTDMERMKLNTGLTMKSIHNHLHTTTDALQDIRFSAEHYRDLRSLPPTSWTQCSMDPTDHINRIWDAEGQEKALPTMLLTGSKFFAVVVGIILLCWMIPLEDACDKSSRASVGEWPTQHWRFYLSGIMQTALMYTPTVLFGILLARVGTEQPDLAHKHALDWRSLVFAFCITTAMACGVILLCMILAKSHFGFPVPFTHLLAGMPGYFMMLNITMLAMFKASKPTAPGIWGHVVQLLTLHVLQLNNVVVFLVLAALIKLHHEYQIVWALGFTVAKSLSQKVLVTAFRNEFDNAVPIIALLNMNCAVFPACILPNAVSFVTYISILVVDVIMITISLRKYWFPGIRVYFAHRNAVKLETDSANALEPLAAMHADFQRQKEESSGVAKEVRALMVKQERRVQRWEVKLMKAREKENALKEAIPEIAQTYDQEETDIARQGVGTELAVKQLMKKSKKGEELTPEEQTTMLNHCDNGSKHSFTAWQQDVMKSEMAIVLLGISQLMEVVIPALAVVVEFFFYFGWNQHAIPSIASLSFSEFMYSQSVKGLTVGVQLLTMIFCGWLINKCTALNFSSVVAWEVSKNFGLLCIACAAQFIFCYATLVPHYNFNVELMVKAFEHGSGPQDDTSFWSYFGTQVKMTAPVNCPVYAVVNASL